MGVGISDTKGRLSLLKGRKRSMLVIAAVLIIAFAILFASYHFYGNLFTDSPPITVNDGYMNVTYSGHFNVISSTDPYLFSSNVSRAVVSDANHAHSYLTVAVQDGQLFYQSAVGHISIDYNLVVSGQFTTNLHPTSLTISYDAKGLINQSGVLLDTSAPPYSNFIPPAHNMSVDSLGKLVHSGFGAVSVTENLLNENSQLSVYNFSVSIPMDIALNWYPDSSHTFHLSARVNGLSKPVIAVISMSIVELEV